MVPAAAPDRELLAPAPDTELIAPAPGGELTRFRGAYVSGRHQRGVTMRTGGDGRQVEPIQDYSTRYLVPPAMAEPAEDVPAGDADDAEAGETLLDVLVAQMEGKGTPAHQVWLPPLADPPTLDQLLDPFGVDPQRGLTTVDRSCHGALRAVAGIVDKPYEQRREALWLDLTEAGGNLVVVGGPRSGKSTTLRTILGSLALAHTPAEVQLFCLDFGGGGLAGLRGLAHVSGVAARRDRDRVRRSIGEAQTLLAEREERFAALGVDSMASYRRLLRTGQVPDDPFGDVFLVVDGWQVLRAEFEDLETAVADLVNRGIGFGIHVFATCNRWMDLRMNVRDMFGTRLELKLGDAIDSQVGRRQAASVPEQAPGRGLTPDGFHFLAGIPRVDGKPTDDGLADGVAHFVAAVNDAWPGPPAPPVRMLPAELPYPDLPAASRNGDRRVPIGIAEQDLQPVYLDFQAEPHMLLFADVQCGKSSFLRVVASGIMSRYQPEEAQLAIVDYRRSLLGHVPNEYQAGYAANAGLTQTMVRLTTDAMTKRLPGGDVSSCGTGAGGPGRSCSCWSTTTTWSPPARTRTRWCRCSTS